MSNPLAEMFHGDQGIRLMTHTVAGYPDMQQSENMVCDMARCGVDIVEIQIPFTDPLADGPVIMEANRDALRNGTTPADCFSMVHRLKREVDIPLLFMTYTNIPYRMGMERFFEKSVACGIDGLIIPDLPFDHDDVALHHLSDKFSLPVIWVISPDMAVSRLKKILSRANGFLYLTLRVGITGPRKELSISGLDFIKVVREHTDIPLAVGFGISSADHVKQLKDCADIAVIGSHIITLMANGGTEKVERFIEECKRA